MSTLTPRTHLRPHLRPHRLRSTSALAAVVCAVLLLGACADDDTDDTDDTDDATTAAVVDPALTGVPEECAAQFPAALDAPDLAEMTRLVDEFPAPPVPATLCVTEQTSTHQAAKYVTDVPPEEVLAAYEPLLTDLFFSRHEAGDGADVPSLIGTPDDVLTQVTAYDGWFQVGASLS